MDVSFGRAVGRFDLVIGVGGVHSQVRSLAFGPAFRRREIRELHNAGKAGDRR